jgi:hypothetical protein
MFFRMWMRIIIRGLLNLNLNKKYNGCLDFDNQVAIFNFKKALHHFVN